MCWNGSLAHRFADTFCKYVGVENRGFRKMWCEGEELKKFVSLVEGL